jgi:hypothetical protein
MVKEKVEALKHLAVESVLKRSAFQPEDLRFASPATIIR